MYSYMTIYTYIQKVFFQMMEGKMIFAAPDIQHCRTRKHKIRWLTTKTFRYQLRLKHGPMSTVGQCIF